MTNDEKQAALISAAHAAFGAAVPQVPINGETVAAFTRFLDVDEAGEVRVFGGRVLAVGSKYSVVETPWEAQTMFCPVESGKGADVPMSLVRLIHELRLAEILP
jgi:hypothetical protein